MLLLVAAFCAALLVSAHLLFWRGRSLHGLRCSAAAQLSGSLDKSLLDGIHTLRYDEAVLEAERDRLLGIKFSQVGLQHLPHDHGLPTREAVRQTAGSSRCSDSLGVACEATAVASVCERAHRMPSMGAA